MTKKILTYALLAAAALQGQAQSTKLLTAEKANEYGIVYSLPQTALEIEVTARHTIEKRGPFYQYAKKYVGTSDVVTEDSEKWEIIDVKVRPYGVPDSGTQYLMQLKPGALTYVEVDADGMLLAINKEPAAPVEEKAKSKSFPEVKWPTGKEYLDYADEDFIASQSSAKQAQLLAETLMEVRDSRLSLTRGTADVMPADGKQLELMLTSLKKQEKALTEAFVGSSTSEIVSRTFSYIPDEEGKEVLFRMSDFAGFADADDLSGDPVYIEMKIANEATIPATETGEPKRIPKNAVIYRLPSSADITISTLGKTLYQKEILLAQKGVNFGLDPLLFTDKKNPSYATFDPVTGALLEIGDMPRAK